VELVTVGTPGDAADFPAGWRNDRPGLFTHTVTDALGRGEIDMAIHSLKDLPVAAPPGIVRAAVLPRADAADVLVSRSGRPLEGLPSGNRVGTSSLRRRAHVARRRPDLHVVECHGNVPTRLRAVRDGRLDAVVLARAGLVRLGLEHEIIEIFPLDSWLPAPGQGAIVVEARADDISLLERLSVIDDRAARLATTAERSFMAALGAGCGTPVAALATPSPGAGWVLAGQVADLRSGRMIRATGRGRLDDEAQALALGRTVATAVLDLGAADVLAAAEREVSLGY
jgi:hydroxymethylbilane synthase